MSVHRSNDAGSHARAKSDDDSYNDVHAVALQETQSRLSVPWVCPSRITSVQLPHCEGSLLILDHDDNNRLVTKAAQKPFIARWSTSRKHFLSNCKIVGSSN